MWIEHKFRIDFNNYLKRFKSTLKYKRQHLLVSLKCKDCIRIKTVDHSIIEHPFKYLTLSRVAPYLLTPNK